VPRRGGAAPRALGRLGLRLLGWRFEGAIPDIPRAVLIVAPHTSNWDFVVGVFALLALGLRATWLGKHTIFRPPVGGLWRALGGVPVDRGAADGVVEAAAALFAAGPAFVGMAPEGTRRKVARWKSGFWRIARAGGVPIVPVAFDWSKRAVVIHPPEATTADYDADLARLQRLYAAGMARHPAQY
jgi:1-acyl-sn-glycerol-3-phosphate acyltransferase